MKKLLILFGFGCIFFGCSFDTVFSEFVEMENLEWKKSNALTFEVTVDSVESLDIFIGLRYVDGIQNREVAVLMQITDPEAQISSKSYSLKIMENGEYLGEGAGDIWDLEVLVEAAKSFSKRGNYTFVLKPDIEASTLPLIMEAGLIIKKSRKEY